MSSYRGPSNLNQTLSYERNSIYEPQRRYGSSSLRPQSISENYSDIYHPREPGRAYRNNGTSSRRYHADDEASTVRGYGASTETSRHQHDSGRSERRTSHAAGEGYGGYKPSAVRENHDLPFRSQSTRRHRDEGRHAGADHGRRYGDERSSKGGRKPSEAGSQYLTGADASAYHSALTARVEGWDDGNYIDRSYGGGSAVLEPYSSGSHRRRERKHHRRH